MVTQWEENDQKLKREKHKRPLQSSTVGRELDFLSIVLRGESNISCYEAN